MRNISALQWIIAVAVIVIAAAAAYAAYLTFFDQDQSENDLSVFGIEEGTELQLVRVRRDTLANSISINGSLRYANRKELTFGTSGIVETVSVEVGDIVEQGQTLASLDAESVVRSSRNVRDAERALREAQDALDELINPPAERIEQARLSALEAQRELLNAQDALDAALSTNQGQIENARIAARLELWDKQQALEQAQSLLDTLPLRRTTQLETARIAVFETQQAIQDAEKALDNLTSPNGTQLETARLAVLQTQQAVAEAQKNLDDLADNHTAALDAALTAALEARQELLDAQNSMESIAASSQLQLAQAQAEAADAAIQLKQAEEALQEAIEGPDQAEIEALRNQVQRANDDLSAAQRAHTDTQTMTQNELQQANRNLQNAREDYRNVFGKWLDIEVSPFGITSPDQIFQQIGVNLQTLYAEGNRTFPAHDRDGIRSNIADDDPDTPWNESTVETWLRFSNLEIIVDCGELSSNSQRACVKNEFDDAWDALKAANDALEFTTTDTAIRIGNANDTLAARQQTLRTLQEQLDELLDPTDQNAIANLTAQRDIAAHNLTIKTQQLQHLQTSQETENLDFLTARHRVKAAQDALAVAEKQLQILQNGVDPLSIELARTTLANAQATHQEAKNTLADIEQPDAAQISILTAQLQNARAAHQEAQHALTQLQQRDDTQEDVLQAQLQDAQIEYQVAQRQLTRIEQDAQLTLQTLQSTETDIARQQVQLATATRDAAQKQLDELLQPDAETIAFRRAVVQSSAADLENAQAQLEGVRITAPFDGVVAAVVIENGDEVLASSDAIVVANPTEFELEGSVDEIDVLSLQVGDIARIAIESLPGEILSGRIGEISAFGSSSTVFESSSSFGSSTSNVVTYPVTIQTDPPSGVQLVDGLTGVAEIVIQEEEDVLLVPIQTLLGSIANPSVLVVGKDGQYTLRSVTLGISDDFWTVVETGIEEGETIVMPVIGRADDDFFFGF